MSSTQTARGHAGRRNRRQTRLYARASAALACLHLILGLSWAAADPVVLHDVDIMADKQFIRGTEATVYVSTTGATDLTTSHPLANARVTLTLLEIEPAKRSAGNARAADQARELASGRTRADGTAVLRFEVPRALPVGTYSLVVRTQSEHGDSTNGQSVTVVDATTVHVRTDRGVYRPGQKVRWRVTAVNTANAHPLAEVPVDVAIHDPHGTAIWSGRVTTDQTGMSHGAIPLDDEVILGGYTVVAKSGDVESSSTIKVRAYNLPPFTVAIEPEGIGPYAPGSEVRGHIVARYLHGEPVAGQVMLSGAGLAFAPASGVAGASGAAGGVSGVLDDHGRMAFRATITDDHDASIRASVTDGAQRSQRSNLALPLVSHHIELAVIPERERFAAGERQWLTILSTDGNGRFQPAEIRVRALGKTRTLSSSGALRVPLTVPASQQGQTFQVRVSARVRGVTAEQTLGIQVSGERFIRPLQAVIQGGAAVAVAIEGKWPRANGPLVATLLREGTPVASSVAVADAETGALRAYIQPPPGVFGLATVRVTHASWDPMSGEVAADMAQATVYLRPTELDVSLSGSTRYRPGQTARVQVEVRDHVGRAVSGAGLAASVVDERALLLAEPGPDLVTALRELGTGSAATAGLAFAELLSREPTPRNRVAMRAFVESLPPDMSEPVVHVSAADRVRAEIVRMGRVHEQVYKTLLRDHRAIGVRDQDGAWEFAYSLDQVLTRAGWKPKDRLTPWRRALDWTYARRLDMTLTFDELAPAMATERLEHLASHAVKNSGALLRGMALSRLVAQGRIPRYVAVDPWGTAIRIEAYESRRDGDDSGDLATGGNRSLKAISAGRDLTFGTEDDIVREDLLSVWGYGSGYGSGYGGLAGRNARVPRIRMGSPSVRVEEVAVRRNFDQTVLWETGLQTDESGRYTLEVGLADSITGWRVEVQALSTQGAMGTARAHLETALPVFMDATMPYALTVGDRYELPVVVANHGDRDKTLHIGAVVSGSLEMAERGAAARAVTLPAGATTMIAIGVRARGMGQGVLDLTLSDGAGKVLDRTQQTLEVDAPGRLERAIHTAESQDKGGQGGQGGKSGQGGKGGKGDKGGRGDKGDNDGLGVAFTVPAHTAGTARGTLRLYRGVADQALDGLDGLLREPHGCFEQTSSTTYPNLLVLRLLGKGADTAAVRERANELVAKGYQRLISYEVSGGGFSWFGQAPANQVLTAYGLMEFVDMAAVYPVDAALIERTRAWLLEQQQADGSWTKDESWLHDWSAVQGKVSTTAYIAWALAESGYRGKALDRALAFLRDHGADLADNPYLLALWSSAESTAQGRGSKSNAALTALASKVARDDQGAHISAGGETLFYTTGKGADVQVTALGAVALGRSGAGARSDVTGALTWLWSARDAGTGWGTTQGTVLALRAYALLSRKEPARGRVDVRLDGELLGTLDLGAPGLPALEIPQARLSSGAHGLTIEPASGSGQSARDLQDTVRADLRMSWRTGPAKHDIAAGLGITLSAASGPVHVGERLDMKAQLSNLTEDVIAMPMVVIPVPPGFQAVAESLEALERSSAIDHVEDQGSEIHVYLPHIDKGARIELPYGLEATAACDVMQRSAQTYAYYNPETRGASAELRLQALPRR